MSTSFLITIKNYLSHLTGTMWNLWFPLLMLASFLLLTLIITLIKGHGKTKINAEAEDKNATVTRKILCSIYLSGLFTLFAFIVIVISLLKFSAFFGNNICQFGVIIGFVLISALTFISYLKLCQKTKNREMSLTNVQISKEFMNKRVKHLKMILNIKLWLFLIVGLPFFMIFIHVNRSNLVSIVLDNSASMYSYLPYGINSLKTVLSQTPNESQYVFTTLNLIRPNDIKDTTLNQYYNSIVNTKNPNSLPTITEIYNNSIGLINAFSQVGDAGGSAILQGIWQNYLVARNFSNSFTTKKMIVISDGMDNLYSFASVPGQYWNNKDIFREQGQLGQSPYEFFNGGIYCINLGGDVNKNLWSDCADSVTFFDGTDQQSYFNALIDILPDMFFDWVLIYILAGWLIITFLALVIAKSTLI